MKAKKSAAGKLSSFSSRYGFVWVFMMESRPSLDRCGGWKRRNLPQVGGGSGEERELGKTACFHEITTRGMHSKIVPEYLLLRS